MIRRPMDHSSNRCLLRGYRAAGQLSLAVLAFSVIAGKAAATTPMEQRILGAPMPHQMLAGSGSASKVNLVYLQGYVEGRPDNAARLVRLKRDVQQCVAERSRDGIPSRPPIAWPDYLMGIREDRYEAVNRSIHYVQTYGYAINVADCSLIERVTSTADLVSNLGLCHIDLLKKTAHGVCNADAHATASLTRFRPGPPDAAGADVAAMRARAAAAAERMRVAMPQRTGEKKTILDVECEVFNNLPNLGGTLCLAFGGSFASWRHVSNPTEGGLLLDVDSKTGARMKAVEARLDAEVNARVFGPYLDAGFTVKNGQLPK